MSKPLDGSLIKKPHQREKLTINQLRNFANCVDPKTGPLYFLRNHYYIQHPTQGRLKFNPWDYQVRLINTYNDYRFSISMLPRQSGKTATAAGFILWHAMFVPDSTILIAAHKYSGAQEIMHRIRYGYEYCTNSIRAGVTSYNKGSIEFDNGSRIISQATTESTGRGLSITLMYVDEFSHVRPSIAKDFWTSISPTLATGGRAIITSTPNSDEDQFAHLWQGANQTTDEFGNETELGKNGFKAYRAYWWEHPERDEKWKKEEMGRIGEERFRREMECEFIRDDETLISPLKLTTLTGVKPEFKTGQVRWYKKPEKDCTYTVSLDPSIGTGGNPSAIQVVELPSLIQIAEWQHNKTPVEGQIKILSDIISYLHETVGTDTKIYYSIENNTVGEAGLLAIREIGEENIKGVFLSDRGSVGRTKKYRKGFNTTNTSKVATCAKLKSMIESNKLTLYSSNLISELKNFIAYGTSYEAKLGETDDLVMALILNVRMIQILQNFDSKIDAKMRDITKDEMKTPLPFIMSISR